MKSNIKKILVATLAVVTISLLFCVALFAADRTYIEVDNVRYAEYTLAEVKTYREASDAWYTASSAPTMDGYLFGGWYDATTEEGETYDSTDKQYDPAPLSYLLQTGEADHVIYAKFVPEHVLSVKAQISANLINEEIFVIGAILEALQCKVTPGVVCASVTMVANLRMVVTPLLMEGVVQRGTENAGVKAGTLGFQFLSQLPQIVVGPFLTLPLCVSGNTPVRTVIGRQDIFFIHAAVLVEEVRVTHQCSCTVRHITGLLNEPLGSLIRIVPVKADQVHPNKYFSVLHILFLHNHAVSQNAGS